MQFSAELGPDISVALPTGGSIALSPDGKLLAAVMRGSDGQVRLGIRRLDQSQLTPLAGTEGAAGPFFSPNGQWIAFSVPGQLKKISAQGGAPVTLCNVFSVGGSWGDDGTIIAVLGVGAGLSRVPEAGGTPAPLTEIKLGEALAHRWPQVLPGSQAVLFTVYGITRDPDDSDIDVISLKSGERKTVHHGGFFARYLPSGHLVFIHQNTLFAAPFDVRRLALTGTPQPVIEGIFNQFDNGGDFDFSQNGTFVYLNGRGTLQRSIFWLDASGRTQPLQPAPGIYAFPRFSPDGKRLAFSLDDGQGHTDIWVRDLERDRTQRLTTLPGRNDLEVWTPDGKGIIFDAQGPTAGGIYWMRSDGSGEAHLLRDHKDRWRPQAISPDGKWLAVLQPVSEGVHILTVPIEGDPDHPKLGTAVPFVATTFTTVFPAFSPDGRWVAYMSGDPAKRGIWVRPFPGPGGQWQLDSTGTFPVWSRKGHELFYLSGGRIMVASYSASNDSFVWDKPHVWSEKRLLNLGSPPVSTYDTAPDGKRFAVVLYTDGTAEEKPITHVTFLLNFFDELRHKASAASEHSHCEASYRTNWPSPEKSVSRTSGFTSGRPDANLPFRANTSRWRPHDGRLLNR
jgi:serine/threonine-protein kinase